VDAYVAVSPTTAAIARANREVAEARLRVVENGIDLDRFHPDAAARAAVRGALGVPAAARVIGTVGRLSPEKDHALLVEAAAPLLGPDLHLVIVGDGPEAAALRARTQALAARASIHLTGARADVPALLAAFDVFALSSRTEGLPLVIPEAMATALPVVSTAVGGIPDVLEEAVTGFLVPAGDAAALRARLAALCADADRAVAVGERARTTALARYSAARMADEYVALYRAALSRA
jgi:glycosyltransferase involved in cell wall biosynthesis